MTNKKKKLDSFKIASMSVFSLEVVITSLMNLEKCWSHMHWDFAQLNDLFGLCRAQWTYCENLDPHLWRGPATINSPFKATIFLSTINLFGPDHVQFLDDKIKCLLYVALCLAAQLLNIKKSNTATPAH